MSILADTGQFCLSAVAQRTFWKQLHPSGYRDALAPWCLIVDDTDRLNLGKTKRTARSQQTNGPILENIVLAIVQPLVAQPIRGWLPPGCSDSLEEYFVKPP